MKSLIVLGVLVLGYVFVGVTPALALAIYGGGLGGCARNGWRCICGVFPVRPLGSWPSLGGATPSPPGICEDAGVAAVIVVVRGTNNGIYLNCWTAGWGGLVGCHRPGGATIDTPACVASAGILSLLCEVWVMSCTGTSLPPAFSLGTDGLVGRICRGHLPLRPSWF